MITNKSNYQKMKQLKNRLKNLDSVQETHFYHTIMSLLAFHVVTMLLKESTNSKKIQGKNKLYQ